MIQVHLFYQGNLLVGYEISGHSTVDADDLDGRLICSAVSSAAIMAANTVTEILGDRAEVGFDDGYLRLRCADPAKCRTILEGLRLHVSALAHEYPDRIKILTEGLS